MFTTASALDIPRDLAPPACVICASEFELRRAEYRPPESLARQLGRRVLAVDLCGYCAGRSDLDAVIEACVIADAARITAAI